MDIEWNDDGLNEMYNQVARDTAVRVQAALDKILEISRGKSVTEVKVLLQDEVRSSLEGDITDPRLTTYAEALAAGRRVKVTAQLS